MKNFVCWHPEMIHRVMTTEAIQGPDHVFLAVHQPIPMYRQGRTEKETRVRFSEEEFLTEFLAPPDFAFVPILGDVGTGKSHLVRWLAAKIKSNEKRRVLLIPKIGANLKDIIGLILEGMEGSQFDKYRALLATASNTLTEAGARELLLSHLATLVGPNTRRDQSHITEVESLLIEQLPALLLDPYFRDYFLRDGGVIDRLTIHTIGRRDQIEYVDQRREFAIDDLPLKVTDVKRASKKAQGFYAFLVGEEEIRKATVRWLNRHLDEAMIQVLNLGRDDLKRLMRDVREALGERNVELVLLIEDFTIAQGIDRQLLDSIIAPPDFVGGKRLCALRTALACTTGYFRGLEDTVRDRTTFRVNLDVGEVGERSIVTEEDVQAFVAKYLNAVRLNEREIYDWAQGATGHGSVGLSEPPSACARCPHQVPCHGSFGQVNEMGIYPFTAKALERMLKLINEGRFNPRTIIKDVLEYTLEHGEKPLREGVFPPPELLDHFGGRTMPGNVRDKIRELDPQNFVRREVLLDLWTDGREVVDLDARIHVAFDLPMLAGGVQQISPSQAPGVAYESPRGKERETPPSDEGKKESDSRARRAGAGLTPAELPATITADLEALDRWGNGAKLPQELAEKLRLMVFETIKERIEWDSELLLEGSLIGAATGKVLFLSRNINFRNSFTTSQPSGIELVIPLQPSELDATVLALQALLLYGHHKSWTFPDGARYFRRYAVQLDSWSHYVLNEIKNGARKSTEPWDPVPAAAELLALGAGLGSYKSLERYSLEDLVNSLFTPLNTADGARRAAEWEELLLYFSSNQIGEQLRELVLSRVACTKGRETEVQIIDASQLVTPLREFGKDWRPKSDIPSDLRTNYEVIRRFRERADRLLEKAAVEEKKRQLAWYDYVISKLGSEASKDEVVASLEAAITEALNKGAFPSTVRLNELEEAINQFKSTSLEPCLGLLKSVREGEDSASLFERLSIVPVDVLQTVSNFLDKATSFIEPALSRVRSEVEDLERSSGAAVDASKEAISSALIELRGMLAEVRGEQ